MLINGVIDKKEIENILHEVNSIFINRFDIYI